MSGDKVVSYSVWIKADTLVNTMIVSLGQSGVYTTSQTGGIFMDSIGTLYNTVFGNGIQVSGAITTDTWIHIVATKIPGGSGTSTQTLYINGVKPSQSNWGTIGTPLSLSSPVIRLGASPSSNQHFNGSIANFRLYSKVLNADQIKELYDYQKDYFLGSKSQVTLYKGHLGVGVTEPSGQLELAGDERLQEYPPRGMTGTDTHIEGHGVFKASASSHHSGSFEPWGVFSDTNNYDLDIWVSGSADWSSTDGTPVVLHYLADNTPGGSWLKIEMPYKIKLDSFSFVTGTRSYSTETFPENFQIWASNNGTEWNQIYSVSGFGNPPNETGGTTWGHTNVNSQTYYSMYAMVITKLYMVGTETRTFASIPRWKLFGTPGPTTLDKGSLSLGRTLDVPHISRYDVDTETPRPEKLVLDFDTTVNNSPTDISGRGNHGAFKGNAVYSTADKAFKFDGEDAGPADYIIGNLNNTGDTDFTVSLWLKKDRSGTAGMLWNFGGSGGTGNPEDSVALEVGTNNNLNYFIFSGPECAISNFGTTYLNRWVHIVATRSGNNLKIYLDGVDQNVTVGGAAPTHTLQLAANTEYTIGARGTGSLGTNSLSGYISNFKVYDVVLEPSEVRKLYNLGRTGRSMVISDTAVGIGKVPGAQLDVRGNINSEGIMTNKNYMFWATGPASQNTQNDHGTSFDVLADFSRIEFELGHGFDTSTKTYTVPCSGYWEFSYCVLARNVSAGNSNYVMGRWLINGGLYDRRAFVYFTGQGGGAQESDLINKIVGYYTAGTTIAVYVNQNTNNTDIYMKREYSHFYGKLLH